MIGMFCAEALAAGPIYDGEHRWFDKEKLVGLEKTKFVFDEPAKAGRIVMTRREIYRAIRLSETAFRPKTCWFGGIDLHHRFFEGFRNMTNKLDGQVFAASWGS
eukprot:COSAG05_NODE_13970_length_412_cov_1.162939_1_plen_104_part_00